MKTKETFFAIVVLLAEIGIARGDTINENKQCKADDISTARRLHGADEIRDALIAIADSEYCGTGIDEGLGIKAAMSGTAPVEGVGFVRLDEEEFLPIAISLAKQELGKCREVLELDDAGAAQKQIARFSRLVTVIGATPDATGQVLDFLEEFAKEPTEKSGGIALDLVPWFWDFWFGQADLNSEVGVKRCLALGEWIEELRGSECDAHRKFCRSLLEKGLKKCENQESYAALARHALRSVENWNDVNYCRSFDRIAETSELQGWVGSIQRRRLAERFANEPLPRLQKWDAEKKMMVEGEIIETMLPLMLKRRAAEELATQESVLTDLRQVYGDWTKEKPEE
jgi:hypothetical protein